MGLGAVYTASSVKSPRGYRAELIVTADEMKVFTKELLDADGVGEASSCS